MIYFKNGFLTFNNMKTNAIQNFFKAAIVILLLLAGTKGSAKAQATKISAHADPLISWFSTNKESIRNEGARAGFDFGISIWKYFSPNYAFSSGISLENAGGRLVSSETTEMKFPKLNATILPGDPVVYRVQYLAIPIGLKLQSNQQGSITLFSDLGLDPKVVVGGRADIPSLDIKHASALEELRTFNLSYHILAGIEYSLGGTNALVLGTGFENNFLDVTKDSGEQAYDRVSHKILKFRIGINF
jgi:hypothetical protein